MAELLDLRLCSRTAGLPQSHRAIYRRASRLFSELGLARADGSYPRLLARLARADVFVIDDWAMAPITEVGRRDLLEILEDRYGTRSTIIISQVPPNRYRPTSGTPTSPSRHTPMPSATASDITPTGRAKGTVSP